MVSIKLDGITSKWTWSIMKSSNETNVILKNALFQSYCFFSDIKGRDGHLKSCKDLFWSLKIFGRQLKNKANLSRNSGEEFQQHYKHTEENH